MDRLNSTAWERGRLGRMSRRLRRVMDRLNSTAWERGRLGRMSRRGVALSGGIG